MTSTDHPVWPRTLITLAIWVALFGLLVALHSAADFIGPLFAGLNLVIAAWPVRTALIRRGAPPVVGTLVLALVVMAVLLFALVALAMSVTALVQELPGYQTEFTTMYNQLIALAATFGITQDWILTQLQSISPASVAGIATSALSGLSGVLVMLGIVVIVVMMLLMDAGSFDDRMESLRRYQPPLAMGLSDFVGGVRRYWVVSSVFGLIVAAVDTALLLAVGVPLAFVWGLLSFLTNFIPNLGFFIGIVPPTLMALLAGGPTKAAIVIVGYTIINVSIQNFIQPKFNGDAVGVTALISFLSLLVWSAVLGPLGALLGLPATLLLKALLVDHDPGRRWFNALLASDPATSDPKEADALERPEHVFGPDEPAAAEVPAKQPQGPAEPVSTAEQPVEK